MFKITVFDSSRISFRSKARQFFVPLGCSLYTCRTKRIPQILCNLTVFLYVGTLHNFTDNNGFIVNQTFSPYIVHIRHSETPTDLICTEQVLERTVFVQVVQAHLCNRTLLTVRNRKYMFSIIENDKTDRCMFETLAS
jgi:hypothetical protein